MAWPADHAPATTAHVRGAARKRSEAVGFSIGSSWAGAAFEVTCPPEARPVWMQPVPGLTLCGPSPPTSGWHQLNRIKHRASDSGNEGMALNWTLVFGFRAWNLPRRSVETCASLCKGVQICATLCKRLRRGYSRIVKYVQGRASLCKYGNCVRREKQKCASPCKLEQGFCYARACARKSLEEEEVDGELKPSIEPSGTIPPGKG